MATRFPSTVSQDMAAFRRAFDPLFSEFFTTARSRGDHYQSAVSALPLDVFAQDDDVVVVAAVPGVDPEAIEITVEKNTVTLSGKAAPAGTGTSATWYLQELPRGSFSRTLTLPFEVDSANADATFDNGLLRLTLPKRESAKARQIRVKVSGAQEAAPHQIEAASTDPEPATTESAD